MPYANNGTGVVYCLTSPSGRKYVGQSWNHRHRLLTYRTLNTNNKVQIKLWRALKKYGFDLFEVEILDYCFTQEQMDDSEVYWISYLGVITNGYNCRPGGSRGGHTEEARHKISEANKKRSKELKMQIIETRRRRGNLNPTDDSKKKNRISNSRYEYTITHPDGSTTITKSLNDFCEIHDLKKQSMHKMCTGKQRFYGGWKVSKKKIPGSKGHRKMSDELKHKLSVIKTGVKRSSETIEKMKISAKNRIITDEYRKILIENGKNCDHKKLAEINRGRKLSKENIEKLRQCNLGRIPWNKGKNLSEEHKQKISDGQIGRKGPMKGKHHSKESKEKIINSLAKYIYTLISPDGEIIETIDIKNKCLELGLVPNCIRLVARGKQLLHKGWSASRRPYIIEKSQQCE